MISSKIMFVVFTAVVTIFALLLNRMNAGGYGNVLRSGDDHTDRHYYHSDRYDSSTSKRQPWTMQKPSSSHSSKSSNSSGRK